MTIEPAVLPSEEVAEQMLRDHYGHHLVTFIGMQYQHHLEGDRVATAWIEAFGNVLERLFPSTDLGED